MNSKLCPSAGYFDMNAGSVCTDMSDCDCGTELRSAKSDLECAWQNRYIDAIHAENDYIEKHGLPLAAYRLF
jgi:post-segregation antitoxin (ccd killing protein)